MKCKRVLPCIERTGRWLVLGLMLAVVVLAARHDVKAEVPQANIGGLVISGRGIDTASVTSLSFFHAAGRHLVSDSTGERVVFRGVNLNGLEFGTFFDNPYPGVEGTNFFGPRPQDLDNIRSSGLNVVRVPFEWARLVSGWQSIDPLPTTLDTVYLGKLDEVVRMASERQIYVVLDMHDFLKYWSGRSAQVCVDTSLAHQHLLARTWKLLATHFRDDPAVLGYDIMNEPVRQEPGEPCGSCNWYKIAQSVVDAIRTEDTNHLIFIEGPNYSLASDWAVENGRTAFTTDRIIPPRIVYSPHVFFDFDNDSRYDQPGEETGPCGQWEYYVRDRLLPMIDWSIDNDVPIFVGETNIPCTAFWATALDHAFRNYFEPLRISVVAWHYVNPERCSLPSCPLNIPACLARHQLNILEKYPGGVYSESSTFIPVPSNSLIYGDVRVNPWDAGVGSWGAPVMDFCATTPVREGSCSLSIHFNQSDFAGTKFVHHFGLDTRRFKSLSFWIFPTGTGQQNFKIFTTGPRSDCDAGPDPIYPPTFSEQPQLRDFLPSPLVGQWQQVEIPLQRIVSPTQSIINGIAFQNMGTSQELFYLDDIRLQPAAAVLHIQVHFQGGTGSGTDRWVNAVTTTLTDTTGSFDTYVVTTTNTGAFTLTGIVPGVYTMTVVSPHMLANRKTGVAVSAPSTAVDMCTLREGDANMDGQVNIADFGWLASSYLKTCGAPGFLWMADFDKSCQVNIGDFGLLAGNYLRMGPIACP